ncbi:MAG: hypothetical protein WCR20_17285 [Verrucomicrobiota bacterium]
MTEIRKIKDAFFDDGKSKKEICKQFRCSWETVTKIIDTPLEKLEEISQETVEGNRKPTVGTLIFLESIKTKLMHEREYRINPSSTAFSMRI